MKALIAMFLMLTTLADKESVSTGGFADHHAQIVKVRGKWEIR